MQEELESSGAGVPLPLESKTPAQVQSKTGTEKKKASPKEKQPPAKPDFEKRAPLRLGMTLDQVQGLPEKERTEALVILRMTQSEYAFFRAQGTRSSEPEKGSQEDSPSASSQKEVGSGPPK